MVRSDSSEVLSKSNAIEGPLVELKKFLPD